MFVLIVSVLPGLAFAVFAKRKKEREMDRDRERGRRIERDK